MDGADWLQFFTDTHRPDAVRILDFPHAAEHLTQLLEALGKTEMHFPPHMLDRCLHILKHRGPRLLSRMADRLESDLAQHKGVQEHLEYLRKREALMRYPQFQNSGWPIGSGMVESANKNVVEARLKGTGMHWGRKNVNPMLALRNAICNDRWREMWKTALTHHRKLQALHRATRAKPRVQACLAGGDASSQESPASPSAAVSERLSPLAPSQFVSEAEAPPVSPLPPVPEASLPGFRRLSSRRIRQTARKRVNCSHQKSSEGHANVCLCGRPLVRFKGHRPKQYCSDRCRQRAHRKRQATIFSPCSPHRLTPEAHRKQTHIHVQRSRHPFVRQDAQTCPCGTPLVRVIGHRPREYCSDRCRQRAHRERHLQAESLPHPSKATSSNASSMCSSLAETPVHTAERMTGCDARVLEHFHKAGTAKRGDHAHSR